MTDTDNYVDLSRTFNFSALPLELKIRVLRYAAPQRTVWIRHEGGQWAAECDDATPPLLQVGDLRKILIDDEYYDVQAPRNIRLDDRIVKNKVYFNPAVDDIVFDLGTNPGAKDLLHWVKESSRHRIKRITVSRANENGENYWDADYYIQELALGLVSLGNVKTLVFPEDTWFRDDIQIIDHGPGGADPIRNGTYLCAEPQYEGVTFEVLKWMDVRSASEIPTLSKKDLPPLFWEGKQKEYTVDEWQPLPGYDWGVFREVYHARTLLEMWFDRLESERKLKRPGMYRYKIDQIKPENAEMWELPDSRPIMIRPEDREVVESDEDSD